MIEKMKPVFLSRWLWCNTGVNRQIKADAPICEITSTNFHSKGQLRTNTQVQTRSGNTQYKHVHDIDQVNVSLKNPEHRRQEGEDRAHSSPAP